METILAQAVVEWQKNTGTSLLAKRKKAFNLKKEKASEENFIKCHRFDTFEQNPLQFSIVYLR